MMEDDIYYECPDELLWENGELVPVTYPVREFSDYEDNLPPESKELSMMRKLIGTLQRSPNRDLEVDCLCLVTSLYYQGQSMTEIAKKHFVTRAAVSKRCVNLCDEFGIDPPRAMRSNRGRKNCEKAQRQKWVEELLKQKEYND